MSKSNVATFPVRDPAGQAAREMRRLSAVNQRALLSLVRRLGDRLRQERNGEVCITMFVKSGSIAQNFTFRDCERVAF